MSTPLSIRLALFTFAVALCFCSPLRAEEKELIVHIDNFTFTPGEITVAPGSQVIWENRDDIPHTVTATNKTFRSKVLDSEQRFSFTFTQPGEYEYFCSLHPHMKGKVVVK